MTVSSNINLVDNIANYLGNQIDNKQISAGESKDLSLHFLKNIEDSTSRTALTASPSIVTQELVQSPKQIPVLKVAHIQVAPTASSRTVAAIESKITPYYLKLHCPKKISRYYRNLGPLTVAHSVEVSKRLAFIIHEKFAYLPESIGIAFRTDSQVK